MNDKLFYSTNEKIVFWIPGYTADNQSTNLQFKINSLLANAQTFVDHCNVKIEDVHTETISKSDRYKYCRMFWAVTDTPPADAYQLGDKWTMWKWVEY